MLESLSVFFPAYNEEGNIERAIQEALLVIPKYAKGFEIIVVDDGSKDKTREIALKYSRENFRVKVVSHEKNLGYGAAVWSGIQKSQYEYIFFTDGDLQFKIEEINLLIPYIKKYEAVVGYRVNRQDSKMRLLNAFGWSLLSRILFGLKMRDIDCAFKLMRANVVKNIPVVSRGAMFSAELMIRLTKLGFHFKEVPVTHLPRLSGRATGAKFSVIFRAFKEMHRVYKTGL